MNIMSRSLTSLEVLGIAIKAEIDAAEVYSKLTKEIKNRALKEKMQFFVSEEKKHRVMLEELYSRKFPKIELKLPSVFLLSKMEIALKEEPPAPELLKIAMEAEKAAEEFYSTQAKASKDMAARTMLDNLSGMERGHYHLLKSECNLLKQFPDYYKVENFHLGDELIHVGP